ncbi:hypothetical protein ACQPZA_04355 [Pseudonocardia xinjiangensis]|uniref:hypothetical protein n=1 Tax=Pseudonocardia xinjiangensis TaxID=75289 RepID=UPI003D8B8C9B
MRSTIRTLLAAAVGAAIVASGSAVFTLTAPAPVPVAAPDTAVVAPPAPVTAGTTAPPTSEAAEPSAVATTEARATPAGPGREVAPVVREPAGRSVLRAPTARAEPARPPSARPAAVSAPSAPSPTALPETVRTTSPQPAHDDERPDHAAGRPRDDGPRRHHDGDVLDELTRPLIDTCERLPLVGLVCR